MIEKRIRWRRIRRGLVLLAGLVLGAPAQSDSALTDENFGGVGGVYRVESDTFAGVGLVEVLILPIPGKDVDVWFLFLHEGFAVRGWE